MAQTKRSRRSRGLVPVHPAAAAIDIGATIHVAAVGPDRDKEPVRTFRTFTHDLHRLADWFAGCGIKNPLICQTGPKTSAKSGCSCSIWEKRWISGLSQSSRMVGRRS